MSDTMHTFEEKFDTQCTVEIKEWLETFENMQIYSYVCSVHDCTFACKIYIHADKSFNVRTIDVAHILSFVNEHMNDDDCTYDYVQAPVDIAVQVFEPYVNKLAHTFATLWQSVSFDDHKQGIYLTMVTLYNKNIYVNRRLLEVAYRRSLLASIASEKDAPQLVSLDASLIDALEENERLSDCLADTRLLDDDADKERRATAEGIYNDLRNACADSFSPRQLDDLKRVYACGATSVADRRLLQRVKQYLESNGITYESLLRRNV